MNNQSHNAIDIVLAESLKALSITKPIEKITIKEITDKAGVIRPTFYNHFQDKYELLEWIAMNELFKPAEPLFASGMLKEGVTYILTAMCNEKEFYKRAVQLEGQNSFNEIFAGCVSRAVLKHISDEGISKSASYSWLTPAEIADFYANSITHLVIKWILEGMRIPVDELAEVYVRVFKTSIVELTKMWV